ncbi:MAG: HIT family protein [Caulobacterales bacterium]
MSNPTALKFGFPNSLIAETATWLVLLRPLQPTLGSLVLVCKEPATAFSALSAQAFQELQTVTKGVETALSALVGYQRINYLMLMMVDRDVHFHVIPRYEGEKSYQNRAFADAGWPGPPALASAVELDAELITKLAADIASAWPKAEPE